MKLVYCLLLLVTTVHAVIVTGPYTYDWTIGAPGDSGWNNKGSSNCVSDTGCEVYACALDSQCNNNGWCTFASDFVLSSSETTWDGPAGLVITATSQPRLCVCYNGYTGAMCEKQPTDLNALTSWKYALPLLVTGVGYIREQIQEMGGLGPNWLFQATGLYASLEYGYHGWMRTTSFVDYLAQLYAIHPNGQLLNRGIYGVDFLSNWMPRHPYNFIKAPTPDPTRSVALHTNPLQCDPSNIYQPEITTVLNTDTFQYEYLDISIDGKRTCQNCIIRDPGPPFACREGSSFQATEPSNANCPFGMKVVGDSVTGLFCACDPDFVDSVDGISVIGRAGCSFNGQCYDPQRTTIPTLPADDALTFTLAAWCINNPLQCQLTNGVTYVSYHAFIVDAPSANEPPYCLCDYDGLAGFFCELDVSSFVFCSGNGQWTRTGDGDAGSCSCNTGWSGVYCEEPKPDILVCGGRGIFIPAYGCACTDVGVWGPYCNETCSDVHCNGRGVCKTISQQGYADGLFSHLDPSYTSRLDGIRVSDICECNQVGDGTQLRWYGPHCTVLSIITADCDGHGTNNSVVPPALGDYTLGDLECIGTPATISDTRAYYFNSTTGRTYQNCSDWISVDQYDKHLHGNRFDANNQPCGYPDRGTCVIPGQFDIQQIATCQCNERYSGDNCGLTRCPMKYGALCSGQGTCIPGINRCVCNDGFVGDACQYYDSGVCDTPNTQFINNAIDTFS